ncbi:unnamed protein product [Rotaria sordida]|uniref:Uncharacterized protein n=1 Tax=Rotaria sordida TaxID=392033 RepID=A0A814YCL4_9BILA|nr:unnamed protein product [Rotaria sordida]
MPTVTEHGFLQLPHFRPEIHDQPSSVIKVIDVNTLPGVSSPPTSFLASTIGKVIVIAIILTVIITVVVVVVVIIKTSTSTSTTATPSVCTCASGWIGSSCTTPTTAVCSCRELFEY